MIAERFKFARCPSARLLGIMQPHLFTSSSVADVDDGVLCAFF